MGNITNSNWKNNILGLVKYSDKPNTPLINRSSELRTMNKSFYISLANSIVLE